jgi:hypothetical protein
VLLEAVGLTEDDILVKNLRASQCWRTAGGRFFNYDVMNGTSYPIYMTRFSYIYIYILTDDIFSDDGCRSISGNELKVMKKIDQAWNYWAERKVLCARKDNP